MFLKNLFLQNFRTYSKSDFSFNKDVVFIVGPNTSGKTNFLEAVNLLSTGKSFKAQNDSEVISFGKEVGRVKGEITDSSLRSSFQFGSSSNASAPAVASGDLGARPAKQGLVKTSPNEKSPRDLLEVVLSATSKKYLVNGVSKRRVDFAGRLLTVLFSPADLDLIIGSPSLRRNFLDSVLEQVDREYRLAVISYSKALRQRNALLQKVQETGVRNEKQFEYWDEVLIKNGQMIIQKRGEFIEFVNKEEKEIFDFKIYYDKSLISKERLLQYKSAEIGAGVTLVGPHRDDFLIKMADKDIKSFGSRGQQRLVVLQLKLIQLLFIRESSGEEPILLLDDIFSELDEGHINLVLQMIGKQQTIVTTTHKEFISEEIQKNAGVIELGNGKV